MHPALRLRSLPAIAWLVLALAWAPMLGQWHQVAHAVPLEQAHAGHTTEGHGHGGALFAGHAPVDCLLLDQLALGDAPPHAAAPALPVQPPAQAHPAYSAQPPLAQRAAPFQARGPPAA